MPPSRMTKRHCPSTRRSMSQTSHSEVSNPHQRRTSSGVVKALKTSSAGASVGAHEHETDRPQHAQVLGHLRLAEAETVDELTDGRLPGAQGIEELASARFGDGVERIGRRRGASHAEIIFRYRNMSSELGDAGLDPRQADLAAAGPGLVEQEPRPVAV